MHIRAAFLVAEMLGCGTADIKSAIQMHVNHGVPLLFGHLVEHHVAQNAGIIHHAINAPEVIQRAFDNAMGTGP